MALFDKGSPRLYPHCFNRQPLLFTICLGSPHDFIWQRQPPSLSALFQQVAPVVSNLLRKPPWLYLAKVAPVFIHIVSIGSPRCLQFTQEAPMTLFDRGSPRLSALFQQVAPVVYNLLRKLPSLSTLFPTCLGSPRCFQFGQEAPVASFSKGSPHVVNMVLIGSPQETSRKPPLLLFVELCIRQPPYDPMHIIIPGSPQVAPII